MSTSNISQLYDIKYIDHYDRFVHASIQRDYKERSMMAMAVLLSCCGLMGQANTEIEGDRLVVMSALAFMTGLYTIHRIDKIFRHTRFI
ncbi:MAG: hypothetical protein KGQ54_01340 [Verrucomicrobia bacterium]|nr:hypothetical protein [Verrucomicrobiota bacterium]NDE63494.1 hypothetical protein [Chlamydiota bacterium]